MNDKLAQALVELLGMVSVPDKHCTCHISPPCSDCVDNAGLRDAVEQGTKVLAEYHAAKELPPTTRKTCYSCFYDRKGNIACGSCDAHYPNWRAK